MIEIATDFPFLGARDYIHGTSILAGFLDALGERGQRGITVKRLKFQRPAKSNGRLFLTPDKIADGDLEAANCTFLASVDGAPWRGFFSEQGKAPGRRVTVSYPITDLQAQGFGGACCIAPANRDDLIRVLVEANKRFHEAALEDASPVAVRFGYLESWAAPPSHAAFSGRLEATNLIAKKTDDGYTTINRLTYSGGESPSTSLTLCFNVTREGRAS